jgi:hypothetical protein
MKLRIEEILMDNDPNQQNPNQQPYQQNPNQQPYQQNPNQQPYQQNPNQQPYQQNPNQQPYPPQGFVPPQPKKKRRWPIIIGIIVIVIAIFACIEASTASKNTATTPTTGSTTNSSSPTATPKPLVWTTVQTFKGSGSEKTDTFTAPATWKLLWTCDPTSFQNIQYNVVATVEDTSGALVDTGVNALCKPGTTSGSTDVTSGGTVRLDIISEGDWTFTVQEQK